MTRHTGPRPGSAPHKVICRLIDLGGTATLLKLMEVLPLENRRLWSFKANVTSTLEGYDFITVKDDMVVATRKGKDFAGACLPSTLQSSQKFVGKIATPRVRGADRPLNIARLYPPTVVREGAFDHQNIPSLMCGKRILPNGQEVGEVIA